MIGIALNSAVVTFIEIIGYSALALHIFRSTLTTIFIVLIAWLSMLLVRGLLESAFRSRSARRVPLLRTQATLVIERISKMLDLIILLLFCGAVLETWRLSTTSWGLIHQVFNFGVTVGETRITLWLVLTAGACLYGSLIASRTLQFLMMRKLFAQSRVDPGIGMSIARLVHYAIVLLGILLALATLGFELTNLTIIASALSVGIGFGLQTIVNNFVCGLILLFERPVKVGDIIQIGGEWATIRDIGLRATTIQTFDRSDIVVPNSDLITNQVTNWTLADRNMRLILTVGVAYGSDVPMVLETLEEYTRENPHILKQPAPSILFMGFGRYSPMDSGRAIRRTFSGPGFFQTPLRSQTNRNGRVALHVLTDHHAPLPGSRNVRAIQCDGVQPFCNRRFRACGRQCAVADIERAWPVRHIDRKAGLETLLDRTASLQTRAAIHGMECLLMTRRVSR